jgi:cytochrome P450
MTSKAPVPAGDPTAPGPATCPQEYYRSLRASGPVMELEGRVTVLGRREVDKALRIPHTFSSRMDAVDLGNARPLIPLQIDPPDHAQYRRLLDPLFSPRNITHLAPVITQRVTELIDAVIAQGHCDFSADLAVPLPVLVFGDLLGLPHNDHPALMSIVNDIVRPSPQDPRRQSAAQAGERCYALFTRALDERARAPRDDLLTQLLHATVDGRRPSREELLDMCYMLVLGGMDTTSDALECVFAFLATHPEHRRQIAAEPSIVPTAVEELLRWESPTTSVRRYLLHDTELGGCPMGAGQRVNVVLASANTDGDHVPDAFEIDLRRTPNHHLAFGAGAHRCLGAHLARLELRTVLREWHRRIPAYTLTANAHLDYRLAGSLRYLEHLPLSWPAPPQAERLHR